MLERTADEVSGELDERRVGGRTVLPEALIACARDLVPLLESGAADEIRSVIRRYVVAVRAVGVPPERAIAAFKFMLSAQPVLHRLRRSDHLGRVADLARIAIDEYFAAAVSR